MRTQHCGAARPTLFPLPPTSSRPSVQLFCLPPYRSPRGGAVKASDERVSVCQNLIRFSQRMRVTLAEVALRPRRGRTGRFRFCGGLGDATLPV